MHSLKDRRILVVDDTESVHDCFYKILCPPDYIDMEEDERILFNLEEKQQISPIHYKIDSAFQGIEAIDRVKEAAESSAPYALAFVDILMPPGFDGIETIKRMWAVDPHIQVVICSAYSEYSWETITEELGVSNSLLFLKKPFEVIEISHLASALTHKWDLDRQVQNQLSDLHSLIENRNFELEKSLALVKATFNATNEGLIVVNKENQITSYNQTFLEQWGLDPQTVQPKYSTHVFDQITEQLVDPAFFRNTLKNIHTYLESKNKQEWHTKDGKTFELQRCPQFHGEEIIGTVCSFSDITERKHFEEQLLHQSTHDSITDLPNRLILNDRVSQAIVHAKRYNLFAPLLLFNLDHFKQINDTFSHNHGDALLQKVAERLKKSLREEDTVTRLDGDEFAILLAPQSCEENIHIFAQKILNIIAEPFDIYGQKIHTTASAGISTYPHHGKDFETLLKNADIALCYSKELGRNIYQFYRTEFSQDVAEKSELLADLHQALERQEFQLHYQPLIDLKTNCAMGVEALLRWKHPKLGMVSPAKFIPLAEETGLILPIGEWVIKTACRQSKAWADAGFADLHMAINISSHQFKQPNFVETIKKMIAQTNANPHTIEIEITESVIMSNLEDCIKKMTDLREIGIHFAIDDFGTGYSNLAYLKHLPVQKIKIDKVFVDDITTNRHDGSIVDAIINLSQKMGLTVLAEGVETIEQLNYLRDHHVDQIQGFYFSKPLNGADCTAFLHNDKS